MQRPPAGVIAGVLVVLGARLAGGERPGVADVHLPSQETLLKDEKTHTCARVHGQAAFPPSLAISHP